MSDTVRPFWIRTYAIARFAPRGVSRQHAPGFPDSDQSFAIKAPPARLASQCAQPRRRAMDRPYKCRESAWRCAERPEPTLPSAPPLRLEKSDIQPHPFLALGRRNRSGLAELRCTERSSGPNPFTPMPCHQVPSRGLRETQRRLTGALAVEKSAKGRSSL